MFATDRDLLVLEPNLFGDVRWSAQTLLAGVAGTMSSDGLTLTMTGVNLPLRGVQAGGVALLDGLPTEIVSLDGTTALKLSRPRGSINDAAVPVLRSTTSVTEVVIATFRPQIGIVHEQMLRALGIEPGTATQADAVGESAITNPRALVRCEALGALHVIFAAASALVGEESVMWTKARMYRERFAEERRRVGAEIDLDGDGQPDAIRRVNAVRLVRG